MKVKSSGISKSIVLDYPVDSKKESFGRQPSFDRHMSSLARELCEERISELSKQIEDQGMLLAQRADMGEMQRYRALIAELLSEVVGNAFVYRKERIVDARGRQKICATVSRINQKLEEIARIILTGCRDALEIMSRIDEIRGLIIDILS